MVFIFVYIRIQVGGIQMRIILLLMQGCPHFTHLALTGGSIGCGPPLAVGAAIACPNRTVINFQAHAPTYKWQQFVQC